MTVIRVRLDEDTPMADDDTLNLTSKGLLRASQPRRLKDLLPGNVMDLSSKALPDVLSPVPLLETSSSNSLDLPETDETSAGIDAKAENWDW